MKASNVFALALLLSGCETDQASEDVVGALAQVDAEGPRALVLSETLRVLPEEPGQQYRRCGTAAGEAQWYLSFSSDGTRLVARTNQGTVRLIATDTWREIVELAFPLGRADAVALSNDGQKLAMLSIEAGQVAVVRTEDGAITHQFAVRPQSFGIPPYGSSLLFSPDDTRLITSLRTVIDLRTGSVTDWTGAPAGPSVPASASVGVRYMRMIGTGDDEHLLAYTQQQLSNQIAGQTLLLTRLGTPEVTTLINDIYSTPFAVSADGRLIAYGPYGIRLHELGQPQPIATDTFGTLVPLDFSPDGTELYTLTQNEIEVLAVPTLKSLRRLPLSFGAEYLGLSPSGLLSASDQDGTTFWDPKTATLHRRLPQQLRSVAWTRDGKLAAGSGPGALLYVWREPDGQPLVLHPHGPDAAVPAGPLGSSTSADGTLAFRVPNRVHTASTDWYARAVEDTTTKTVVRRFPYVREVEAALSPDGERLTTLEYETSPRYLAVWCR